MITKIKQKAEISIDDAVDFQVDWDCDHGEECKAWESHALSALQDKLEYYLQRLRSAISPAGFELVLLEKGSPSRPLRLQLRLIQMVTRGAGDTIAIGKCGKCGRHCSLASANKTGARCRSCKTQYNASGVAL